MLPERLSSLHPVPPVSAPPHPVAAPVLFVRFQLHTGALSLAVDFTVEDTGLSSKQTIAKLTLLCSDGSRHRYALSTRRAAKTDSSTMRWRAPQLHRGIQRMLRKTAHAQHRDLTVTCIAGLPLAISARAPLALHHDPKSVISIAQVGASRVPLHCFIVSCESFSQPLTRCSPQHILISIAQCADPESDFASCVEFRTLSAVTCGTFLSVVVSSLRARCVRVPCARAYSVHRPIYVPSAP